MGKPETDRFPGEAPPRAAEPLDGLFLEATCISDNQRLAVINGRIYQQNEKVQSPTSDATVGVLAKILPDKVLLKIQDKMFEMKYSNDPRLSNTPTGANAASRSKSPTARSKSR